MLSFQSFHLFQIISSVYNNITDTIKKTLKKVNNSIPDNIKYKILNTYSLINKKLNKHRENLLKIKDNIIHKKNNIYMDINNRKNNIYTNIINRKRNINSYIEDKLYNYLEKNEYHKIN
tara:strand:+ start:796 stop:1152 length:357 start_codon:yes stop_codon:yes gene_type:complete